MLELRRRGWNRGAMQRALGMRKGNWRKADGKEWIYPTEQIRFSRQLRRIISGEIELKQTTRRSRRDARQPGPRFQQTVVLATQPQPLVPPMKKVYSLKTGRLVDVPAYTPPENPLPNFKAILENVPRGHWRW